MNKQEEVGTPAQSSIVESVVIGVVKASQSRVAGPELVTACGYEMILL
jgi:hypothetical protein